MAMPPPGTAAMTAHGMCPRVVAPSMVTAKEVFGQYYEASPPVQKKMQTLPPPIAKGAMAGLVAIGGAAGFALTPSRRIPVNAVGGLVTAAVGNVARNRLSSVRQKAAVPAVAAMLSEGLAKVSEEALNGIATEYDVPKKEFQTQMAELFLTYLSATLNSHVVETSELSELLRLQQLLRLSSAQVGAQVYSAARQLYSRHRAYLEDTEPNDSKRLLGKFVFLAERLLAEDESPEGYKYESLRLQKLFSLTLIEWRAMAEEAAIPFYERALTSAVLEAKPVTAEQLAAVRASLGITPGAAEGMHAEIFGRSAAAALGADGRFAEADKERLAVTRALLGMDEAAAAGCLRGLTTPLYSTTFNEVVGELEGVEGAEADERVTAQLAGKLTLRAQELLLDETADAEGAALRAAAQAQLADAVKYMRAQNLPEALSRTQALVASCSRVAAFLIAAGRAEGDVDTVLGRLYAGAKGDLKQSEVLALYRSLLLSFLEKLKVEAEESTALARLRLLLGLSEAESASVYQAAAGPLFRASLVRAVEAADYGAAPKAAMQASLSDLSLPAAVTAEICKDVYAGQLRSFVGEDNKVLDEEQSASLASLRAFLDLEMADVQAEHEAVCGPAYSNSVKEVMGTSGVIPDEYWEGLAALRERLGLSEDSAKAVFATEVTAKMKEFGTKAVEALQEKLDPQSANKEAGGEGSMNMAAGASFTTELLNLVDFAVASKAIIVEDGQTMGIGANLRGELSERALQELYKQYLMEAFSGAESTTQSKIFESLGKLSLVLGLTDREITSIHNEVGSMIYRQYVGKALVKGPLGKDQVTFLASIKDTLGMEQALCDELVRDQQLNRVSVLIESMFEKDEVLAEDVRSMRDTADLYRIDLLNDLQVPMAKLERLFNVELEELLETAELTADDMTPLGELCESLQISEARATTLLTDMVQRRVSGGVLQAAAQMRDGNTEAAVADLKAMLKFAAVLEDVQAECSVSAAERSELYMLFQAGQLSGDDDTVLRQAQLEMLKAVMGMASVAA